MDDFEQESMPQAAPAEFGEAAPEQQEFQQQDFQQQDFQGFAVAPPAAEPAGDDFGFPQQGAETAAPVADASADPFAEQAAPAAPAFTETPAQDNSFAYAPSPVVEAPPAPVPSGPSPYKLWEIENQKRLEEKRRAEDNEKKMIIEEAEAEKDLFYSQRKKKVEATMATNRETQKLASDVEGANVWDKAVKLIGVDASKAAPEKKTAGLDLGKYKALLVKLKHKPISCA